MQKKLEEVKEIIESIRAEDVQHHERVKVKSLIEKLEAELFLIRERIK